WYARSLRLLTEARAAKQCVPRTGTRLADLDEIYNKNEGLIRPDVRTCTGFPVCQVRRDFEATTPAGLHPEEAVIPALNGPTRASGEVQRLTAIPRGIEFTAG